MVGGPILITVFLTYLGIVALIPLISGLLGFSRRIAYLMTAVLTCGLIYLDAVTFADALKYQDAYRLLLVQAGTTALGALELFIAFVLAHWLGTQLRTAFVWAISRLR